MFDLSHFIVRSLLNLALAGAVGLGVAGCAISSPPPQVPIELGTGGAGQVASARLTRYADHVLVSGTVKNWSMMHNATGHIEVLVLDRRGREVARVTAHILPREVPATIRGLTGSSSFAVPLPTEPPPSGRLRVLFLPDSPARP
ncbi:MAG TPA: hypothetical protein VGO11_18525 [Chthoniobacteraceae bacterium]|jgi:hypothetical protein|nr:hypothetical protein [Chthoniobacteraceae bacterium]